MAEINNTTAAINKFSPRILDCYEFLKRIAKCRSDKKRLIYLRNANREELLSLVEIASNILSPNNFAISNHHKIKLTPHANFIRQLSRVRSESAARNIIQQRGNGFAFSALLIPLISEVGHLLLKKYGGSE
jgi:hypothetical protein